MPYGSVGGMERLALGFYNYYKKVGYDVKALKFIKLDNDIIKFGEDELFLSDYDFYQMSKIQRLLFYVKAPYLINRIIKNHKFTHSIAFGDMANLFSSLSFSKEFKIGSIHALKSTEFKNKTIFNTISKLGYKTSYKFLDKLVCISIAIKEDLIKNCSYKFDNIEIIYNPHDLIDIIRLSKEAIIEDDEKEIFSKQTILFLGRLSIQKAPWHLIKSFKLVLNQFPDTNLVIIGDGDSNVTQHLQNLIEELNIKKSVHLLGRRNNPYKYLVKSNVLALSSYYEGTPNVIVEAMCLETPIVSTYCTKGIIELMSLKNHSETNINIEVEAGIITPNIFKGKLLQIPNDNKLIKEEILFADALKKMLETNNYKKQLQEHKIKLLGKFDINKITMQYIKK